MASAKRFLMVVAVICLFLAALGVGAVVNLGWLGLAVWALTSLL